MCTLSEDIERLSKRINEMDAEIDALASRVDGRQNARSKLYRAMHREHLRLRNTAARKLSELTARANGKAETFSPSGDDRKPPAADDFPLKSAAGRLFAVR